MSYGLSQLQNTIQKIQQRNQSYYKQNYFQEFIFMQDKIFFSYLGKLASLTKKLAADLWIFIVLLWWIIPKSWGQQVMASILAICTRKNMNFIYNKLRSMRKSFQNRMSKRMNRGLTSLRQNGKNELLKSKLKDKINNEKGVVLLQNTSNQVLLNVKQEDEKATLTYYVPTYLRVLLKNFTAIDLDKLEAEVNADIIITFVYGTQSLLKLPKEVANRLNNEVILNFQRDEPLRLSTVDSDHISVKENEKQSYITFTVRRKFHVKIESDVYYTPFEKLYLHFPITIQQLAATKINVKNPGQLYKSPRKKNPEDYVYEAGVKFNCMNNLTPFVVLDFKDESKFGNYSIIQSGLRTTYSNQKIMQPHEKKKLLQQQQEEKEKFKDMQEALKSKKQQLEICEQGQQRQQLHFAVNKLEQKLLDRKNQIQNNEKTLKEKEIDPDHFQYSLFKIPIYKHPFASLVMIFLPLWSLAILNLGIFFQGECLSQRISSIAGVMIAFMALIPLIRSQIPPNPNVLFVECLVYAEIFASFLCLMDSLQIRAISTYNMEWTQNLFYRVSLSILILQVVVIMLMSFYHFAVSLHNYKLDEEDLEWKRDKNKNKFSHSKWNNRYCNQKFSNVIERTKETIKHLKSQDSIKRNWKMKLSDLKKELQSQKGNIEEQRIQKAMETCIQKLLERRVINMNISQTEVKQQKQPHNDSKEMKLRTRKSNTTKLQQQHQ